MLCTVLYHIKIIVRYKWVKRPYLVGLCKIFHQVLQRQLHHRYFAYIVHYLIKRPYWLLEKYKIMTWEYWWSKKWFYQCRWRISDQWIPRFQTSQLLRQQSGSHLLGHHLGTHEGYFPKSFWPSRLRMSSNMTIFGTKKKPS